MKSGKGSLILRRLLLDLLITGAALVVFALFHHVLPREQESVGIAIPNPYSSTGGFQWTGLLMESASAEEAETLVAAGSSRQRRASPGSGGMNQKGGSALVEGEETAPEDQAAEELPMQEKFSERYSAETVITETSYTSPDIAISISRETTDDGNVSYYVADIYLRNISCFRSALAGNTYGSGYRADITAMAALNNALVAINGDYYGNTREGVVIRNGMIYRANPTDCDVCVLYYDGTMRVMPGSAFTVEDAIADGAWQAWTFGPALLDGSGHAITSFSSTNRIRSANPRTAIGYYEPGHYCMIVVDGRGESDGMTLAQLSSLFEELGCRAAYNLDGGNSSVMVWNGEVLNDPSGGGRASSDALLIAEVD